MTENDQYALRGIKRAQFIQQLTQADQRLLPKTVAVRERAWEVLDEFSRTGMRFSTRDVWDRAGGHYGQTVIVLQHARRLGWVCKVAFGRYRVSSQ